MKIRVPSRLKQRLQPHILKADRFTGGAGSIFLRAYRTFHMNNGVDAAAAMAFYSVFSLFPLLALLVIVASLLVPTENISIMLGNYLSPIFPASRTLIDQIIKRFVEVRTATGVVGAVVLFWAASGVFVVLARNINRAWENARRRNFVQYRLIAISTVGVLLALLVAAVLSSILFGFLTQRAPHLFEGLDPHTPLIVVLIKLAPMVLAFLVLLVAYRLLPTAPVKMSEAAWGSLVVTIAWSITSSLFSWYIGIGAANYDTVFGPLAAVAVLLLWIYANSVLVIFGAYLSASIGRHQIEKHQPMIKMHKKE